jgi:hypothetical protein
MPDDQEIDELKQRLSSLDFRANNQVQNRLYRRLLRQAQRPSYHQPIQVTVFSRLSAVVLLALVCGAFWGMLQTQDVVAPIYATISAPQLSPISTPPNMLTAGNPALSVELCPLPTPLAPSLTENRPVPQTGTLLP